MRDDTIKELDFIRCHLQNAGFSFALKPFGSAAKGSPNPRDIDVAVIVRAEEKASVLANLRRLGASPERSMNWAIDVFDSQNQVFGYNKRTAGTMHLLLMSQDEYESDSPLAKNVRAASASKEINSST